MPKHRSDGLQPSAGAGRVKAVSRASGSANALALTRPDPADTLMPTRSPLTNKTVAHPCPRFWVMLGRLAFFLSRPPASP